MRIGAGLAATGALLALIAGIGRTSMAMARNKDLPATLAQLHPRFRVPHRAEVTAGVLVAGLVFFVDLRGANGFSSFGVLLYYLIANLAALSQQRPARRYPRAMQVLGAVLCLTLIVTLPWSAVAAGMGVLVIGVLVRAVRLRSELSR